MKVIALILIIAGLTQQEETGLLKDFHHSNNLFSVNVYKQLKSNAGNFLACPVSVHLVLSFAYAGAGGTTAEEISSTLHLPKNEESLEQTFREVNPKLQVHANYTLTSANKLYVKDGLKLKQKFKNTAVNVFGAEIQNIDFEKGTEAVSEINKWVEDKTDNKIKNLLKPTDVDVDTRAVIVNAIYFKGTWSEQFDKRSTTQKPFYLTKRTYTNVDMMEQTAYFNFYEDKNLNAKFVQLPYVGKDMSLIVVLPKDFEGLAALENRLEDVVAPREYTRNRVNIRLPKFKIETTTNLKTVLQELGVKQAFSDTANFTEIIDAKDEALYISKFVQKALIDVDEEGTVAAVATAAVFHTKSAPAPPKKFHANHPFIFYLEHKDIGITFIGRYSAPSGTVQTSDHSAEESAEEQDSSLIFVVFNDTNTNQQES